MHTLVQYVKDNKNKRVGVVVAIDSETFGWSKCKMREDEFSEERALEIAMGRAIKGSSNPVAHSVQPTMQLMVDRAERYYKEEDVAYED